MEINIFQRANENNCTIHSTKVTYGLHQQSQCDPSRCSAHPLTEGKKPCLAMICLQSMHTIPRPQPAASTYSFSRSVIAKSVNSIGEVEVSLSSSELFLPTDPSLRHRRVSSADSRMIPPLHGLPPRPHFSDKLTSPRSPDDPAKSVAEAVAGFHWLFGNRLSRSVTAKTVFGRDVDDRGTSLCRVAIVLVAENSEIMVATEVPRNRKCRGATVPITWGEEPFFVAAPLPVNIAGRGERSTGCYFFPLKKYQLYRNITLN